MIPLRGFALMLINRATPRNEVPLNRRNHRNDQYRRPSAGKGRSAPAKRRPAPPKRRAPRPAPLDENSTGRESGYLQGLAQGSSELTIVLCGGESLTGQLVWHDPDCLKIAPSDGSPGLLIPKESIKYIYEAARVPAAAQ
jgi:hypothetical protein